MHYYILLPIIPLYYILLGIITYYYILLCIISHYYLLFRIPPYYYILLSIITSLLPIITWYVTNIILFFLVRDEYYIVFF